jgi:hypothetical protein
MTDKPVSPLRQRMIEDMTVRHFKEKVQKDYIRPAILNHPPLPDFSRRSVFRFREAVWSL